MSLLKTSAWSVMIVMVGALVGFISQKLYAVYVGAEGLLLIGNFNNFSSIAFIAASGGASAGIVNRIAEAGTKEEQQKLLGPIFGLLLFFSILTALILFMMDGLIYPYLYKGIRVSSLVNYLFYLSLPFIILSNGMLFVMNGRRAVKSYSAITVSVHLINLVVTWFLVRQAWINGALLSLFLPAVLGFFLMMAVSREHFALPSFNLKKNLSSGFYRSLAGFSMVSIFSIFLLSVSQLLIRDFVSTEFTISEAGSWQVLSNFSRIWMAVITGIFSMYFFPLVSSLNEKDEIVREVKRLLLMGVPALAIAFSVVFAFKSEIIPLVYSPDFSTAADFMVFQLTGDLLRSVGMVFAYVLLARSQLKSYAVSELSFTVVYVVLSVWLGGLYAMTGVFAAYVVSYLFFIFMQLWLYRRLFWK